MASGQSSRFLFGTSFQVLSAVLPWLLLLARVAAQNRSDEVGALLSFRDVNNNEDYSVPYCNTWNESNLNPCAWVGVTCTANYTVEELDFSGWGLFGELDLAPLSKLTDLLNLDLSSNLLTHFPRNISMLTRLTRLDISRSNVNGNIPDEISACRNLQVISLQQNQFSGEITSLLSLANLQVLLLADNLLSGSIPNELGELSNLVIVDLSNNFLNGSIPPLPKLTNLVNLTLDNNNFTEFQEPWSLGVKSLTYLSISCNQLGGNIPSSIAALSNLLFLNMSHNLLSGSIPLEFSQLMRTVSSLDLSQNQFTGKIPADMLQQTTGLSCVWLNLSSNHLSGNVPINGTQRFCFEVLDLSHNNLNGSLPPNLFSNSTSAISFFSLQNNSISGDLMDVLQGPGLMSIGELRVPNNLFTGDISRLSNTSFGKLSSALQALDLSNNDLRWSTSETISDPIRDTLLALTASGYLKELWVGGNNFSGTSLPSGCFVYNSSGSGPSLAVLDLSGSQLMGEILDAAFNNTCNLTSLKYLNLSNNDISGHVPGSIVMLSQLKVLDVSNNHLFGLLPLSLLSSPLSVPSSFGGNDGLCGYPLPYPCLNARRGGPGGVPWPLLVLIIGGCLAIAMGSCSFWKLRKVYKRRHQEDAHLIKALLKKESITLMSLRELKKATENFVDSAQIGEGGFGNVYIGILNNGTRVAIKKSKRAGSLKDKEQFLNEVRILSQVNHRNLVKLLGCCMENKVALLVFEFVSNGTLQEHLHGKLGVVSLTWKQRLKIAVQTADALNYLHSTTMFPIYHRDVKSANILLDDNLNAKVADFGISKLAPTEATHVTTLAIQGTMGYIDPEYYTSYQFSEKSDVYSFGVVLLELISAKSALDSSRDGEERSLVYFSRPYIARGDLQGLIDPSLVEIYNDLASNGRESILNIGRLAVKCLDMQSKARPSMHIILKELEIQWVQLDNKSGYVDYSTNKDRNENLEPVTQDGNTFLQVSRSFSTEIASSIVQSDVSGIQMSKLSGPSRFGSRSMG